MDIGTWEPFLVVGVAFVLETFIGWLIEALGRRRGTVVDRHDPIRVVLLLFLKAQFVFITLLILWVVISTEGTPPDAPTDPAALLPDQLAQWMRDERAAVVHLRDVLGGALLYLALQLWRAFSLTCRLGFGRQPVAASAPTAS